MKQHILMYPQEKVWYIQFGNTSLRKTATFFVREHHLVHLKRDTRHKISIGYIHGKVTNIKDKVFAQNNHLLL
jgi:hypothetical protein